MSKETDAQLREALKNYSWLLDNDDHLWFIPNDVSLEDLADREFHCQGDSYDIATEDGLREASILETPEEHASQD
jgi:hypothetical protein